MYLHIQSNLYVLMDIHICTCKNIRALTCAPAPLIFATRLRENCLLYRSLAVMEHRHIWSKHARVACMKCVCLPLRLLRATPAHPEGMRVAHINQVYMSLLQISAAIHVLPSMLVATRLSCSLPPGCHARCASLRKRSWPVPCVHQLVRMLVQDNARKTHHTWMIAAKIHLSSVQGVFASLQAHGLNVVCHGYVLCVFKATHFHKRCQHVSFLYLRMPIPCCCGGIIVPPGS